MPLQLAVASGCSAAVEMLLKKGAVLGKADAKGRNALHSAAEKNDAQILKVIVFIRTELFQTFVQRRFLRKFEEKWKKVRVESFR